MKCPNEIRACPNGWSDCSPCAYLKACRAGTYTPEPDPEPEPEPDLSELEEDELTVDLSIPILRETWAEQFASKSHNDRMKEFYRYHASDLHFKEPIPLMGPSAPGGGSKSRVKKSKKGNKVFTNVWEGI